MVTILENTLSASPESFWKIIIRNNTNIICIVLVAGMACILKGESQFIAVILEENTRIIVFSHQIYFGPDLNRLKPT